ncbi:MAG: zf-HC2 domain-containing protein [Planctomycetes bacterium]|nr:zf-HC2 domain-containing protein [Planctomycetota bacterium]
MNCEQSHELLIREASGDRLPSPDAGSLEAHLAGCAACRAERDSARAMVRRLRASPTETVPFRTRRALADLILDPEEAARILPEPTVRASWFRRYAPPFAAAAIFLIALTAMLWPRTRPKDPGPSLTNESTDRKPPPPEPLAPADHQWGGSFEETVGRIDGQMNPLRRPRSQGPRRDEPSFEQRLHWVAEQIAVLQREVDQF